MDLFDELYKVMNECLTVREMERALYLETVLFEDIITEEEKNEIKTHKLVI